MNRNQLEKKIKDVVWANGRKGGKLIFLKRDLIQEMQDFSVLTAFIIKNTELGNQSMIVCLGWVYIIDFDRSHTKPLIYFGCFHYNPSISAVEIVDTINQILYPYAHQIRTSPSSSIKAPALMVGFKK